MINNSNISPIFKAGNWCVCLIQQGKERTFVVLCHNKLNLLPPFCVFVCLRACVTMHSTLLQAHSREMQLIGVCALISTPQLFQKLKNLMRPYSVEFESPLELSAQGRSKQTHSNICCTRAHAHISIWCIQYIWNDIDAICPALTTGQGIYSNSCCLIYKSD